MKKPNHGVQNQVPDFRVLSVIPNTYDAICYKAILGFRGN